MKETTSLKQKVCDYILNLPLTLYKGEVYTNVKNKFNLNSKQVSEYYRELDRKGLISKYKELPETSISENDFEKIVKQDGQNLSVSVKTDKEVKSLEDLLKICEVDTLTWEVISWQCKKWDLGIKDINNEISTKNLYSVSAKFRKIKEEDNILLQKDVILKELFLKSPKFKQYPYESAGRNKTLLELALFDMHFGKLAHKEESGEDYDIKIASSRYRNAIGELLSRIDLSKIDRILLPLGNDLINVDSSSNQTTAGTPQDCDSRFYKIVRTVKELLIETIIRLTLIAPVDVVICVGNHDQQTAFMIGEMLEAYFHSNENVTVDNCASFRKYYKFGNTSIMFTHGDKEKHTNLGMIFAAEKPQLWASTTQRYIQIGHFHHNKKIDYISNQEFQGFQTQIIPSLSSSDAWHAGKGYISLKQAKSFIYDYKDGLIGEFTYTAK